MIVARRNRHGPYVSRNGINANLPGEKTPETITLDEAVGLDRRPCRERRRIRRASQTPSPWRGAGEERRLLRRQRPPPSRETGQLRAPPRHRRKSKKRIEAAE